MKWKWRVISVSLFGVLWVYKSQLTEKCFKLKKKMGGGWICLIYSVPTGPPLALQGSLIHLLVWSSPLERSHEYNLWNVKWFPNKLYMRPEKKKKAKRNHQTISQGGNAASNCVGNSSGKLGSKYSQCPGCSRAAEGDAGRSRGVCERTRVGPQRRQGSWKRHEASSSTNPEL